MEKSLSSLKFDSSSSHKDILESTRLKSLILLEAGSVENQYFQGNMLVMSRLWITYIGFVTGMIMAIIGAIFILGKLRENLSELKAKIAGYDISLKSASPGIILSCLGACLMITALVVHHEINSKHDSIYINDKVPIVVTQENTKPALRQSIDDSAIMPK